MSCLKRKKTSTPFEEDDSDDFSCVEPIEDSNSIGGISSKDGIKTINSNLNYSNFGSNITSERLSVTQKSFTPATVLRLTNKYKRGSNNFKTPVNKSIFNSAKSSALFTPFATSGLRTGSVRKTSTNTPSVETSSVIVALIEGRGNAKGELGMASFDLRSPVLMLYQFTDSQTYTTLITKLNILNPIQLIMANTVCESSSRVLKIISEKSSVKITPVNRKYFNDQKGSDYIKRLCLEDYTTLEYQIKFKYYSLSAAYALLKFIEYNQDSVFVSSSLKIEFKGDDHSTSIDYLTAKNLELLKSLSATPLAKGASLYDCLKNTRTYMGSRLLRSNILQPLCCAETIKERLDMVGELLENSSLYHELRNATIYFHDVNRLLGHLVTTPNGNNTKSAEVSLMVVVLLKHILEAVPLLRHALQQARSELFKTYHALSNDERFDAMLEQVLHVINEDVHYSKDALATRIQKCFAIKADSNGLLEVSRRTYSEAIEDISNLVDQLAQKYNLSLRSQYNVSRGFFLTLPVSERNLEELPKEFIKITKQKNNYFFTTFEIINLNEKVKISLEEIYTLSSNVARELIERVRPTLSCLYKLSECVALIDMVTCFAFNCINSSSPYVRPVFSETLAIKNGHHPILFTNNNASTTANHTYASEKCSFVIVSGANMSGKSTYLRQIVLLQIMAQMGSYVPAEAASFRIAGHIFSRIGCDVDVGLDLSTFMAEMREMSYIIQNVTDTSLIIIDELAGSTCEDEGVALCVSIIEHLINIKAFCFFATHHRQIMMLEDIYPAIECYHFSQTDDLKSDGEISHILVRGKLPESHYGIKLAKNSALPQEIVINAENFCQQLKNR